MAYCEEKTVMSPGIKLPATVMPSGGVMRKMVEAGGCRRNVSLMTALR